MSNVEPTKRTSASTGEVSIGTELWRAVRAWVARQLQADSWRVGPAARIDSGLNDDGKIGLNSECVSRAKAGEQAETEGREIRVDPWAGLFQK